MILRISNRFDNGELQERFSLLKDNNICKMEDVSKERTFGSQLSTHSNRKSDFFRVAQPFSQSKYTYIPCSYSSVIACGWDSR